ncbi:DUF3219 family protein [Bacillus sinesaloumensis]|uniref:DUF3219 family protein n=1 Tax=Litchfieldia sinesaloumensis TaxID=1926280 RepID=UPI0009883E23|nr:DUF3219 family protein [Bacillus sinesaloumensis]
MVHEIILDNYSLKVTEYQEKQVDDLLVITVRFKVTSEEYHDVTTQLYKGKFSLVVPERNIECKVMIKEYSTSITNLYKKDQVGDFTLTLREIKD